MSKLAIATLIKNPGDNYTNWENTLVIVRNQSIAKNFKGICDLIFFHEGDISEEYKEKIRYRSCVNFNYKFIEVPDFKITDSEIQNLKPQILDIGNVRTGYSSMCKFWSYRFLNYLEDYDYVIRLDDDCIVLNDIQPVIDELETKYLSFPTLGNEDFRYGLESFIKAYFDKPILDIEKVSVPYTNFCGFNLKKIRANKSIRNFFKEVENNEFIHKYAWNDTLIWGILMKYMIGEENWSEHKQIKYIHLSHLTYVN